MVFEPGVTYIPTSGMVVGDEERANLHQAADELLLCSNHFAAQFEREFAEFMGVRYCSLVNSGSSANLLALSALELPKGSEVITCAVEFPTTVNPIIQCGLVPVFVDCIIPNYNIDVSQLEKALTGKTRAVMIAHALGNPFDLDVVEWFCTVHELHLINDCCDAVGSLYRGYPVAKWGALSTASFYPAHHITMGEGGAVLTNDPKLRKSVESYRDWGRDCWCEPGCDNTCGKRFDQQLGTLPEGYDHKYIYSKIGYNMKATDMQAAVGVAQLPKLPGFIAIRKHNYQRLYDGLADMISVFILPEATLDSDPSWFGFPLTVRRPYKRLDIVRHLESHKIGTRPLFGGNLLRQPAYAHLNGSGNFPNADRVMNDTFWIGVYPGITDEMIDYMLDVFHAI